MSLLSFGANIWIADGPFVNFFGFPYPTRMTVVRLSDGSAWLWSPIQYTEELAQEIEATVGPIAHLVSPNKIHWMSLQEWKEHYPQATLYASPGLEARRVAKSLQFDKTLNEAPDGSYADDIDQTIFRGGVMDEVVFYHKASKTVIFTDLIQRNDVSHMPGWKQRLMKADDLVGPNGSTPCEWRFFFFVSGKLASAKETLHSVVLETWHPKRLVIAHGECAAEGASEIIKYNLRWMRPLRETCNCMPSGQADQAEGSNSKDD